MSIDRHDINDDEIRIIGNNNNFVRHANSEQRIFIEEEELVDKHSDDCDLCLSCSSPCDESEDSTSEELCSSSLCNDEPEIDHLSRESDRRESSRVISYGLSNLNFCIVDRHEAPEADEDMLNELPEAVASEPQRRRKRVMVMSICAAIIVVAAAVIYFLRTTDDTVEVTTIASTATVTTPVNAGAIVESATPKACVAVTDTTVNNVELKILTPRNALPSMLFADEVAGDTTGVLRLQAADIRADNGGIAGAFVMRGELVSRGQSKAGFCAIVDGNMTIGVSDASPMLEAAIEADGYFFRQFPLVVGGQVVENKPRGRALRKALAELDGNFCVILSIKKLTFQEFSQALVDLGVRNAIYLVGGAAPVEYTDEQGNKVTVGRSTNPTPSGYLNFLIWR